MSITDFSFNYAFDKKFWDERYKSGNTGWDIGHVSTPLKHYFDQLKDKNLKILIPGCGNAYEAEYLCEKGFTDITLLEISSVIAERLKLKFKDKSNVKILVQNFFEHDRKYDLIIEQTFFCSLMPALRKQYCIKMDSILNSVGKLTGLLFGVEFEKEGPPFGGSIDEYKVLFDQQFNTHILESSYNSIEPRQGKEIFFILKKKS